MELYKEAAAAGTRSPSPTWAIATGWDWGLPRMRSGRWGRTRRRRRRAMRAPSTSWALAPRKDSGRPRTRSGLLDSRRVQRRSAIRTSPRAAAVCARTERGTRPPAAVAAPAGGGRGPAGVCVSLPRGGGVGVWRAVGDGGGAPETRGAHPPCRACRWLTTTVLGRSASLARCRWCMVGVGHRGWSQRAWAYRVGAACRCCWSPPPP